MVETVYRMTRESLPNPINPFHKFTIWTANRKSVIQVLAESAIQTIFARQQ